MTSITTTRPTPTVPVVAGDRVWPLPAALLAAFARTVVRLAGGLAGLAERGQLGPDAEVTASRRSGARV
jgi:hypothetical protein